MLLELISQFSKVVGYKINTHTKTPFLYAKDKLIEREIKNGIPYTVVTTKKIKYLGINLMKEVTDLYNKSYFFQH